MQIRKPAVAGQFYGGTKRACIDEIKDCISLAHIPKEQLPETIVAGIVPHAGWTFSGELAAMVFSAIKQADEKVDTFVIFGAVHSYMGSLAAVYDKGQWRTPLGDIWIDETLAAEIIKTSTPAESEPDAHKFEHSIEVQVPFIQHLFPKAKIVPVMTPPATFAVQLGSDVAGCIKKVPDKKIVCIGSTDLTHYGPRYGFCPHGTGSEALKWAKEVNDQAFIDLAVNMKAQEVLTTSMEKENACGCGAAAATIASAKAQGKTAGQLLSHTHSNEVMQQKFNQSSEESVGYAAIVF